MRSNNEARTSWENNEYPKLLDAQFHRHGEFIQLADFVVCMFDSAFASGIPIGAPADPEIQEPRGTPSIHCM
jgi:hypothetical protein